MSKNFREGTAHYKNLVFGVLIVILSVLLGGLLYNGLIN